MRIILYTGKGGVGKTTIAAATALKSAQRGQKTLILSTDAAHSLGDSFDIKLSNEPLEIEKNLFAQEIDPTHEAEKGWGKVQQYLTSLLTSKAVKDITTEELTMFPGMEDLLSLIRILDYYKSNAFDVIVIDCAPTGETLALLSFPDMLRWWMEKLFPMKKKAIKIAKPIVEPIFKIPLPSDSVIGEFEKIYIQLDEMRKVLSDRSITSIRIVVNPEKMVIKEAQRSFTYLNIYDFNIDAIIMNRVIPEGVRDDYFKAWKDIQKKYMDMVKESFSPIPIYSAPLLQREVVGVEMLRHMGEELFEDEDPTGIKYDIRTQQVIKEGDEYVYSIYLPFADKQDISLNTKGDELIIKVGSIKRVITIPRKLQRLQVKGAKFEEDYLKVRFCGREE